MLKPDPCPAPVDAGEVCEGDGDRREGVAVSYRRPIHHTIAMLLMVAGLAVAADSKSDNLWPALVGIAIGALGLAIALGPDLFGRWRKNDKTPE